MTLENQNFKIYTADGKQFIEHLFYPKMKAEITFGEHSDLENIAIDEDVIDVGDIAKMLRQAGEYILHNSKG